MDRNRAAFSRDPRRSPSGASRGSTARRLWATALCLLAWSHAGAPALTAQLGPAPNVRGVLIDGETGQPVALARMFLIAEEGDTVATALSRTDGFFFLGAPRPGSFYLSASILGYRTATAGVFDLGEDGEIAVRFPIRREAITLEEILVSVSPSRLFEHSLVRNGFLDRLRMGLGYYITPARIADSPWARTLTDLLRDSPRVEIEEGGPGGGRVQMRDAMGGTCSPKVYVDGILMSTDGMDMDMIAPLNWVEAVEVYPSALTAPLQYSGVLDPRERPCGVILVWTK